MKFMAVSCSFMSWACKWLVCGAVVFGGLCLVPCVAQPPAVATGASPVLIGFDGAYGQKTNTANIAIELGARAAMDEINRSGGVLGGRPLQLVVTDNKGIAARGRDNFIELASMKGMVAILEGKFSPISVEVLPDAHRLKMPLVSDWGSADTITDHFYHPSYSFRVSLRDEWAVEEMIRRLAFRYKASKACVLLPNTAWGRSADNVIKSKAGKWRVHFSMVRWYNWGDQSFAEAYRACIEAKGQAMLFVGNEREAAVFLKDLSHIPKNQRLPVVAHMGVTGGVLHELVGEALDQVTFDVIQTFTFIRNERPQAKSLVQWIQQHSHYKTPESIPSPVGAAHAYDAVHLLALAVNLAGSTDPQKVRDALEQVPEHAGAIRDYRRPFANARHEALGSEQMLFVRLTPAGVLQPVP
jgi:branched-chain amino acid transport system substrate-binding protein